METARARSAATLAALGVLLVVMAVVGWKSATTAFPSLSGDTPAPACVKTEVKKVIYRKEITVSVYNASKKSGFADRTMDSMERRNFVVGAVGNAPDDTDVPRVEVRTTVKDDPRAELVAEQYKPKAAITVSENALGPGIDVVLGPKAPRPVVPAPKSLKLDKPTSTCVDEPSASAGATTNGA